MRLSTRPYTSIFDTVTVIVLWAGSVIRGAGSVVALGVMSAVFAEEEITDDRLVPKLETLDTELTVLLL